MNTRVNLLYFIEILCDLSPKAGFNGYIDMIKEDLFQIVNSVAPSDGTGAANTGTVRRVRFHCRSSSKVLTQYIENICIFQANGQ